MSNSDQPSHMADDPRTASRAARAAERAWSGLYGRGGVQVRLTRVVPTGWTVAARRMLRTLDRKLRAANDRAEEELLDIARDFDRDPDCIRFARGVRGLLRLERVWGWVRSQSARLDRKAAQLGSVRGRMALREALGGDAALRRWEAAWVREEGKPADHDEGAIATGTKVEAIGYDVVEGGCGLRGCDCVKCGGEFVGYDFSRGDAVASRAGSACRADGERERDWLRATFRLAGTPARSRGTAMSNPAPRGGRRRSGAGSGSGRARFTRIPVWPQELRERDSRATGRQVWTRGDTGLPGRIESEGVAAQCRGP